MRVGLQRDHGQPALDGPREPLDRVAVRLSVGIGRFQVDDDRLAEPHQRLAAEGVLFGVVDAGGNDRDGVEARAEGDARRARFELLQPRVAVRRPLREDGDRSAAPQHLARAAERLLIRPRHVVLPPVDGDGIDGPAEPADDRIAEQRRLGQKGDRPRGEAEDEQRIDQAVGMVRGEDHRPGGRDVLQPHHLDAPEKHLRGETEDTGHDTTH